MLLFLICSFFIHTSSTASYTLSLHDALPISVFFPNQDPSSPGVCRLSDTKPFHSTFFQVLVGDISRIGVMETRCEGPDRKSTRLNSSHSSISYAVFCLKKNNKIRVSSL